MVPQLLPQNCNHQEESLEKGGWQGETKVHRVHPVSRTVSWRRQPRALAGAVARVVISTIATPAVMSRGLAGNENDTFKTTVQEPRDRTGLPAVASALCGCRWISHDSQWNSGQSRRGLLVRLTIVFSRLWNLVHAAKVILVVPLPKNGGRIVQKSYWNDLVLSSTEDDLLRELELDRPSALWISVPKEPGPATFPLSWSSGSSLARCASSLVSMQKCVPAVIRHALTALWGCEVYNVFFGLAASAHMHVHKGDVTAAFLHGCDTELGAWRAGRACSRALGDTQVATMECVQRGKAMDGLVNVPRAWWTKVNQVMAHLGWIASSLEPCLC